MGRGVLVVCLAGACGRIGFDREDGALPAPPMPGASCQGLAATCGPAGTSSCCASPPVPGGTFYRSGDAGSDVSVPDTQSPATVSAFYFDQYEVTVGRFRQFVNAGVGTQANPPAAGAGGRTLNGAAGQGGWDPSWNSQLAADQAALSAALACQPPYSTWTATAGANESLPITCVTWFEAVVFCAWDGGFLPTEAEWNFAAAGGDEQRAYPWSTPPSAIPIDCTYANYGPGGTPCVNGLNRAGGDSPKGDGKWGHADLAGNAFEWTLDWNTPYGNPCIDCANLGSGTDRVVRGGSFGHDASYARTSTRSSVGTPSYRSGDTGLRCARH